jgi:phospholipase/carboxylesterase
MTSQGIHETIMIGDWVIRKRNPAEDGPFPVFLLLHGWTGDENAMWIFSPRLPSNALLLAPRGLYSTPLGGYSWQPVHTKVWPSLDDLASAVQAILDLLTEDHFPQADFRHLSLVGFSQGTALAYTMLLRQSQRIHSVAGLSGFLPIGAEEFAKAGSLAGKSVFIAHGSEDDLVPVDRARAAVRLLQGAGAHVTYCEDEVGHKLSLNCFRGLESFFRDVSNHR